MVTFLAARCTMESNRRRMTYIGPTRNDEMCNFYIMYYVTDGQILEDDSCGGERTIRELLGGETILLEYFPDDASLL
ncbi:Peptidylglycine alpha-hydroxylating monooxygenase [Orchesella cincta]|uniref:Peptidylglycine alpha-hydroxylating monooxygenase n=1 Tax=Orchesella cincta TaxID=48709 RepID=A0A1D2M0W5_ORCCI|nr:Peptidylglycine alpha-hydroxylating monooxygenase [Orchesella cincta]